VVTLESLDAKLEMMCQSLQEINGRLALLNGLVREHDREIARIKERQAMGNIIQSGLSAILASIAAYLGISR
jgi:hypothetical protein